jgi:hypothetical protein
VRSRAPSDRLPTIVRAVFAFINVMALLTLIVAYGPFFLAAYHYRKYQKKTRHR